MFCVPVLRAPTEGSVPTGQTCVSTIPAWQGADAALGPDSFLPGWGQACDRAGLCTRRTDRRTDGWMAISAAIWSAGDWARGCSYDAPDSGGHTVTREFTRSHGIASAPEMQTGIRKQTTASQSSGRVQTSTFWRKENNERIGSPRNERVGHRTGPRERLVLTFGGSIWSQR